jgi:excisionase family DNA binding protein
MKQIRRAVKQLVGPTEPLLTTRQAAALFGVEIHFFYQHRELPRLNVGRHIRFSESALRQYFSQQSLKH